MSENPVKFIVISFHYQGGGIAETFDTESELDAWLAVHKPSGFSSERFLIIRGKILDTITPD